MKQCVMCKAIKLLSDFSKKRDSADGFTTRCKACLSLIRKADYAKRGELIREQNTRWYAANKNAVRERRNGRYDSEKSKAQCKRYYAANKKVFREACAKWAAENPDKVRMAWREYSRRNRHYRNAQSVKRRAAKRHRYARWDRELTDFVTTEATQLARQRAKRFGFTWDVDHVVPLMGTNISGLHVWNNLQVIPSVVNRAKSNKWPLMMQE